MSNKIFVSSTMNPNPESFYTNWREYQKRSVSDTLPYKLDPTSTADLVGDPIDSEIKLNIGNPRRSGRSIMNKLTETDWLYYAYADSLNKSYSTAEWMSDVFSYTQIFAGAFERSLVSVGPDIHLVGNVISIDNRNGKLTHIPTPGYITQWNKNCFNIPFKRNRMTNLELAMLCSTTAIN